MVHKKKKVKSAKQLSGASICVLPGTTTELNAADYFRSNNMKVEGRLLLKILLNYQKHSSLVVAM